MVAHTFLSMADTPSGEGGINPTIIFCQNFHEIKETYTSQEELRETPKRF